MATPSRLTRQAQQTYFVVRRCFGGKASGFLPRSQSLRPVAASLCGVGAVAAAGYFLYKEKRWLLHAPVVQAREIPMKVSGRLACQQRAAPRQTRRTWPCPPARFGCSSCMIFVHYCLHGCIM